MSLLDDIKDYPASRWGKIATPENARALQRIARRARQFIFDADASRKLGHFIVTCPDIIANQLEFARPPYDPCYIEIDIEAMHDEMKRPRVTDEAERDWRVGYAVDGDSIKVLANKLTSPMGSIVPFGLYDFMLGRRHEASKYTDGVADNTERILLGTTYSDLPPPLRARFRERFGIAFYGATEDMRDYAAALKGGQGEARNYAAALLLLYQQQHITIGDRAPERHVVRGKLRTMMAYHTVTIHLDDEVQMRRAFATGHHASPRLHEVRTHYAHRYGTRTCEHDWLRIEDADNEQWRCRKCDRLRWLKRHFLRGDASRGVIIKDYHVTP